MDLREYINDPEEALRSVFAGLMKQVWTVMPAQVSVDSQDGHVATAQPTIKRQVTNSDGSISYEDHPEHPDLPIHHLGGGPVVTTHPTSKGDTGAILYASRPIDSWFNSGGSQQPMEDRAHHLGDGLFLSGIRSTPQKLQQVSQNSAQTRTVDKKSVIDHGPNGTHHKTVDPSEKAASASFDPFASAKKFFEHILHPSNGHAVNATDNDTTHSTSLTHADGFTAAANNGAHSVKAHPEDGVAVKSSTAHTIDAPNASLDKAGNLSAKQNISSKSGNISAPSGSVSGLTGGFGALTGIGGGAIGSIKALAAAIGAMTGGSVQVTGAVQGASLQGNTVEANTLQTMQAFTVAGLNEAYPPSQTLLGMRAYVSDASGPAFNQALTGGGTRGCGALCIADPSGDGPTFMWVGG